MFVSTSVRRSSALAARGVTLIELLVGIAILAIALAMGVPSFAEWISNSQIRSTAESVQNALNLARAEAVRRNTTVLLQFTDKLDSGCALSSAGTSWVISRASVDTVTGKCNSAVDDQTTPFILEKGTPVSTKAGATVAVTQGSFGTGAAQTTIAFNGLGRVTAATNPVTTVGALSVDLQSSRGTCVKDSGKMRCLRVVVSPGGQVRMCDPARTVTTDPMACPAS
jgi:type IV fimbrial biogenesis protein FimT